MPHQMIETKKNVDLLSKEAMFSAGLHFGYTRSRRHPSVRDYIFGRKHKNEIFDLEKTSKSLSDALHYVKEISGKGKRILLVGSKPAARQAIHDAALMLGVPFVAG